MIAIKVLIFLNLFYCFASINSQAGASSTAPAVDGAIKIEFVDEQRKITVEGVRNKSWTGDEYFAFRGIPYVKPPIGELRFKDPQPLDELPSLIDARQDGHDCPSIYATNASENCLTLNIYTPSTIATASLPVLVFIHPGGLYIGSSLSTLISPAYLLSKPMVVVTFNYRLGTLGFLQLGTREIPGNAGFKDQVHALHWVAKYIRHFGGNPKDVTLMGYSAGALSVSLHLVSPMSQGLFHKAIIMSGSLPPQTPLAQRAQLELMRKQARALNCSEVVEGEAEILNCLQKFSGSEIAATLRRLFTFGKDNPIYIYLPVIENDFGQARFLTETPKESLQRGAFAKVPILLGFTNGEFCQSAVDIVRNERLAHRFYEEFEQLAPEIFMYAGHKGNLSEASVTLRDYYLPRFSGLESSDIARLCDFFSDAIIRFGAQHLAELAAPHKKVFPYSFEFRGEFSNLDYNVKPARVEHMDDLMYLFEMPASSFKHSESNAAMIRQYTKFIYNFVKRGSLLIGQLPTYPTGYTKIYRTLEFQPGTFLANDTYDMWKRLFL
ncbi:juvenile hormone esterase-like [Rhagoletis pomonella]|uniref:juvenile hormone esterase-like n=1 Tax=Rhagoletis pomonella TaxID=28610 RepID=UPI001784DA5C|nr:juvenile hormone esterase-like [Rhagoletis pomonella]